MAGVFYKHAEGKPVTVLTGRRRLRGCPLRRASFKILLGFEHHNGCEVILTCEDFGIKEGKK